LARRRRKRLAPRRGRRQRGHPGFFIPDELLHEILYPIQNSIFRSRALVSPMNSSTLDIPLLNTRNTPAAGQSPFFGGVVARWTEDGIALNQLAPQLQNQKLKAHLLAAYVVLSNTLLSDSPAHLARRLQVTLASAWSWHEEQAFLLGTGVGQPLGVAVSPAAISVTRTTGNDFTLTDAAAMVAKLLPGWSPKTTCWIVHPTLHAKLFALAANAGPAVTLTLFGKTPKLVLLGIPVETTDVLPALGTPRDVVLADLAYYAIGTRQDFALAYSGEPFFTSNQGVWRLTSRVDGAPFVSGPITLADGSQVGPFAYLA
jgi:HK97 family phage major capsid protein